MDNFLHPEKTIHCFKLVDTVEAEYRRIKAGDRHGGSIGSGRAYGEPFSPGVFV